MATVLPSTAHSRMAPPTTVWSVAVVIPLFQLAQLGTCPLPVDQVSVSPSKALVAIRCTTARQQLPTLPLLAVVVQWLEVSRSSSAS